ncbi:hypothetical protein VOLCADRAFT_94549 [Volvox carteri f. nagariensis]|uniref:TmcB/TmcC TPR repeats domain-containing protein n=1 Tax=Volvox carteri f. nagariensis TaxID=3068 RepID=D8U531_VOLCA|nr:uncharacterized protein VOLCADRAFT_94549 [Volvox carteri f. nagariensis]EFJ45146.1 hypothetical protein VOLCADRAFT_94549 [Volvox carteri f. nagariensis]|eukprot:XP_002953822.1 hypothetical protein VOLCADRAFT_94549 [Volvox carteri f. nagariensis]
MAAHWLKGPDHANPDGQGEDLFDRRSSLENGIFAVLFTLRKENTEARIRIRWTLIQITLGGWQLFTTVIDPSKQPWDMNPDSTAWKIVGILDFEWLVHVGYNAYLAVLYTMVTLLMVNCGLCVWVAWCFKEQKFPVVWPVKALRLFNAVFLHAFDIASLNVLQLGINCRFTGPEHPHLRFDMLPKYSCVKPPHVMHAVVSGLALTLFVVLSLVSIMAQVEVNLLSNRPSALGHSGPEMIAFMIRLHLKVQKAFCTGDAKWTAPAAAYHIPGFFSCCLRVDEGADDAGSSRHRLATRGFLHTCGPVRGIGVAVHSMGEASNPHLVAWVNYLKGGVAVTVVWCSVSLTVLVFHPGINGQHMKDYSRAITLVMLLGLAPAFTLGALMSWRMISYMTKSALKALATAKPDAPLREICPNIDSPQDVELVARCCRVWKDRYNLDPDAVHKARQVIQVHAGLAMFPTSAYMVLLHGNFMIDVLGVSQSGSRRIEDARKLDPNFMCRFIMFVRHQQASQLAAGKQSNGGANMDLLAYVEYQRKQRMVVRLHREALQAICSFWKALDSSTVSFTTLSKGLGKIESSVTQAQAAYRVVLETYGNNPKLVRLYGKFLQTIKNDPWRASEYFSEADRLEELMNGDSSGGPLLPDGQPACPRALRLQERAAYPYPHRYAALWIFSILHLMRAAAVSTAALAHATRDDAHGDIKEEVVVGMHYERLAFPIKLSMRKASGVGEDSTFITMMEAVPPVRGVASLWVAHNGTIVACDPQFVMAFGWKSQEINGTSLTAVVSIANLEWQPTGERGDLEAARVIVRDDSPSDAVKRLITRAKAAAARGRGQHSVRCLVMHKYDSQPVSCTLTLPEPVDTEAPVHEVRFRTTESDQSQLLVVNRKGNILHAASELATSLKDAGGVTLGVIAGSTGHGGGVGHGSAGGGGGLGHGGAAGANSVAMAAGLPVGPSADQLAGFTLCDFLPTPWKEMHIKHLKATTNTCPVSRNPWTCRKEATTGPTLEMRSTSGKPLFVRVSVSTADVAGELNHVIRVTRSSLEAALAERRLLLELNHEGEVINVVGGNPATLFGLETGKLTGHPLWDVLDWSTLTEAGKLPAEGRPMFFNLVRREVVEPGYSWRVNVSPPARLGPGTSELFALARSNSARPAFLKVHIEMAAPGNEDAGQSHKVFIELWPAPNLSGVLEVDSNGRVRTVLEERMRPVGHLFGVSSPSLVGKLLSELVVMPQGRTKPSDLLSMNGVKKSSLKSSSADAAVKQSTVGGVAAGGTSEAEDEVQNFRTMFPSFTREESLRVLALPPPPIPPDVLGLPAVPATAAHVHRPRREKVATGTAGDKGKTEDPEELRIRLRKASVGTETVMATVEAAAAEAAAFEEGGGGGIGRRKVSGARTRRQVTSSPPPRPPIDDGGSTEGGGKGPSSTKSPDAAVGAGQGQRPKDVTDDEDAVSSRSGSDEDRTLGSSSQTPDAQSVLGAPSGAGDMDHEKVWQSTTPAADRIANWITSKGVFYQNSVAPLDAYDPKSDDEGSRLSDDGVKDDLPQGPVDIRALLRKGLQETETTVAAKAKPDMREPHSVDGSPPLTTRPSRDLNGLADDDAASDGGQSALSAQSDDATDYKRGKRYRKLVKLMDSGQAQLVQQRFRTNALTTVAMLAAVHIVCFALTIYAIETKRGSMVELGRTGQAQRYMNQTITDLYDVHVLIFGQIITDVRSLDNIAKNKTLPTLYTRDDAKASACASTCEVRTIPAILGGRFRVMNIVARIARGADEIQARMKDVLDKHHSRISKVHEVLFHSRRRAWKGNDVDGSDVYTNLTIWDFSTRFIAMAKQVEQHADVWLANNVSIADTEAGQFLIKSGPDFWSASRQASTRPYLLPTPGHPLPVDVAAISLGRLATVLDSLLYMAVGDARWVEDLQLAILTTEGFGITSFAACYLAYIIRALVAQRYKLYNTFMVIPAGLARTLASQNTSLDVDGDDDEDEDDEDDKPSITGGQQEELGSDGGGSGEGLPAAAVKHKRRATLNVERNLDATGGGSGGRSGASTSARGGGRSLSAGSEDEVVRISGGHDKSSLRQRQQAESLLLSNVSSVAAAGGSGGYLGQLMRRVRGTFFRRGSVAPHPLLADNAWGTASKRKLKYDSHETLMVVTPFAMWALLVFYSQELVSIDDPALLKARRAAVANVLKLVRDAWYTLQLGERAFKSIGDDAERFPLVKEGMAYASQELADLFYKGGPCHQAACPGPSYRFYEITRTSLDSMMQQYLMRLDALAYDRSPNPPGLSNSDFDLIYNIGTKDLLNGAVAIQLTHLDIILNRFRGVFILHVVLFILLWVIFGGFMVLMLFPLLRRISRERRRVAELLSQLPLELDVEKLVARALSATAGASGGGPGSFKGASLGASGSGGSGGGGGGGLFGAISSLRSAEPAAAAAAAGSPGNMVETDNASKWKAIIKYVRAYATQRRREYM